MTGNSADDPVYAFNSYTAEQIFFGPGGEEGGKEGQKNFARPYLLPSSE